MRIKKAPSKRHPKGELIKPKKVEQIVDSYGGPVRVSWDPDAAVTQFGQLVYFVEFLKAAGLFEQWVEDCPLRYSSNNASSKHDVLGTILLSLLAGHKRYAHITNIRSDQVTPELLGMTKVVSEDAVRRALIAMDKEDGDLWLKKHLRKCSEALLAEPWILDIDSTVKPLYGHQEGAVVGYNPQKPGRPSHIYHTYFAANVRMILDTDVQPGNQASAMHAQPGLWSYIDELPKKSLPQFIRGDCAWGNQRAMQESEKRKINYLFKLKQSPNVKKLIHRAFARIDWVDAGQGWEGLDEQMELCGWSKKRRVVVLRRTIKESILLTDHPAPLQRQLAFIESDAPIGKYEYAILVTSMEEEILTLAQHYRDRADIENVFDEMKNQWSWGGYTTHDLARCQIISRVAALVFNWWSLYSGLIFPDRHAEAITTRPLLLHAVGRQTHHAGQKRVIITSSHAQNSAVRKALNAASSFLSKIKLAAEQLTVTQRWQMILSRIFVRFLRGRILGTHPPNILALVAA
jgi:Transposase DDE domain group 1